MSPKRVLWRESKNQFFEPYSNALPDRALYGLLREWQQGDLALKAPLIGHCLVINSLAWMKATSPSVLGRT
jgi:hypothetical protein